MPEGTEQPNVQSDKAEAGSTSLKSLADFKSLPLAEMEKELASKDYSKANPLNLDQEQKDSDNSDEDSDAEDNSTDEQTSDETESKDEESTESDNTTQTDDQKKEKKEDSLEERFTKLEKSNKELQAEFTRRSQKLKELEKQLATKEVESEKSPASKDDQEETDPELAQLQKKDPKAYDALNKMIDRVVEKRVTEKVKPVEEQVTLRRRQENTSKFGTAIDSFAKGPLAELEPQMVEIINENPSEWQRQIWENGATAFENLEAKLYLRHKDRVVKLLAQAEKSGNASSEKQERLKKSQVGTKTKVSQPAKGVMSSDDFRKLSLAEMEKRLPKVRN